jgi:hypothetical protein
MSNALPHPYDRAATKHHLRRHIERYVEDLVRGLGSQSPKETDIVLDVLKHIGARKKIEGRSLLGQQILAEEPQALVLALLG